MTIQQWEERSSIALASNQDAAVHRLAEWAQSADAAYQVAERLSASAFVPAQFKGKPVELTAAILSGLEVGLSPMAAMRSFDIIQGQAAPKAITLRAIVQSHGHEMVLVESTATRCKMKGKRRGSDEWQPVTWTIDRARDLQLTGKDNWKKQPGAMLLARATSELARLIASDAILGIGYSSEEVADGGTFEQTVAADTAAPAAPTGTRKMSRPMPNPETSAPAEPNQGAATDSVEPPTADVEQPAGAEPRDTEGQMKAMHASFNEAGITERQDRLDFAMSVVNREIESSNDLTWDERGAVIDALKALPRDAEIVG